MPRLTRVDQAVEALREALVQRRWVGALPGSRQLQRSLGVSAETMSATLARLREEGWIRSPGPRRRFRILDSALPPHPETVLQRKVLLLAAAAEQLTEPSVLTLTMAAMLGEKLDPAKWTVRVHRVTFGRDRRNHHQWDHMVASERPDLIIFANGTPWLARWAADQQVPVFFFGGTPGKIQIPTVGVSGTESLKKALHELVRLGHRRIALPVCGRPEPFARILRRDFGEVFALYGLPFVPQVHVPATEDSGPEAFRECLRRAWPYLRPTAIICIDWYEYLATAGMLQERGLRVPDDVSLLLFIPEPAVEWAWPDPARFLYPTAEIADVLARWVLNPPAVQPAAPFIDVDAVWHPGQSIMALAK